MLSLAFISWDSKIFAQCEPNAFVFSLSPGITKSGAILSMETGIWPIAGKVGILAGPAMYDEKHTTKEGTETVTQIDFSGRIIYKITKLGSNSPQLLTAFGSVRGMIGASYRFYFSIGETQLFGIEPFYSNKTGVGVNLLFTARL